MTDHQYSPQWGSSGLGWLSTIPCPPAFAEMDGIQFPKWLVGAIDGADYDFLKFIFWAQIADLHHEDLSHCFPGCRLGHSAPFLDGSETVSPSSSLTVLPGSCEYLVVSIIFTLKKKKTCTSSSPGL